MPTITASGLGSGLDITSLVTQLVAAEGQPATQRLDRREAQAQAKLTAYGTLKGAFDAFQTSLGTLKSASSFLSKSATSSDPTVATAKATSAAVPGTFNLDIAQLAKAQSLVSDSSLPAAQFTSLTDVVGTGSITFKFGVTNYDAVTDTFTTPSFEPNPNKVAETVQITDGSLSGIRDAINQADIGITAATVFDGTHYRLTFSVNDTGKANGLEITVADDDGNNNDALGGLSLFSFNRTSSNLLETNAAQDAALTVNGIAITSASNELSNTLDGVTLNLLQGGNSTATLTVANDANVITGNIRDFVGKYNALVGTINDLSSYDPATNTAGTLNGDSILRSLESQLSRMVSNPVAGATQGFSILADIGITRNSRDGTLVLDNVKLESVIASNPDAVTGMFAAFGQINDSLIGYSGSTAGTQPGEYAVNISQLASQGALVAQAGVAANLTITAGVNDSLSLSVDGVAAAVTLQAGTYTVSALVAELQSKINATAAFKKSDVSIAVAETAGELTVTSNRFGSASKVSVAGGNAATGLFGAAPTATDGLDVQGTIGGFDAIGSGQTLKGTNVATGLALEIKGGALGDRGLVNFTRGYAAQLGDFLSGVLVTDGIFTSVTDGLNQRIERINADREILARRLSGFEDRVRRQFSAMDVLVSQLQATSNFLNNQLASLPVIGSTTSNRK